MSHHVWDAVFHSYGLVLSLIIDSTPPLDATYIAAHPNTPMYERSATPFWKLLFLFEALICQPESSTMKLNANVLRRLKWLSAGHLQELFDELSLCLPTKPTNQAHPADIDEWNDNTFGLLDHDIAANLLQHANPGAQKAADRDNLHAAFSILTTYYPLL